MAGITKKLLTLGRPALRLALAAGLLVETGGCTRPFFRKRADEEVCGSAGAERQVCRLDHRELARLRRSACRFADPSDPDHPPKPPDDPAAYALSPNPQKPPKKAGIERIEGTGYLELIAQWDKENRERRQGQEDEARETRTERSRPSPEASRPCKRRPTEQRAGQAPRQRMMQADAATRTHRRDRGSQGAARCSTSRDGPPTC